MLPIPSDGEGVGSTFSMAAGCGRAMKPGRGKSGGPRGGRWMASVCSPRAFRCGPMPSSRMTPSPPRSGRREAPGAIRSKARRRAASRRACGKRPRGAACLVETVTLQQHRARPGCPAPSPTAFPEAANSRARFSFAGAGAGEAQTHAPNPAGHQRPFATPSNRRNKHAGNQPSNAVPHRLDLRGARL